MHVEINQPKSGIPGLLAIGVGIILVVLGLIAFIVWQANRETPASQREQVVKATVETSVREAEAQRNEAEVRDKVAAQRWEAFHGGAQKALLLLDEIARRFASVKGRIGSLLSDGAGADIAANPDLLASYEALKAEDDADLMALDGARSRLASMVEIASSQLRQKTGVSPVPESEQHALTELEGVVRGMARSVTTMEQDVQKLVDVARTDSFTPSAGQTLRQALDERALERERMIVDRAAADIRRAQREADEREADIRIADAAARANDVIRGKEAEFQRSLKEREDYFTRIQEEKEAQHKLELARVEAEAARRLEELRLQVVEKQKQADATAAQAAHEALVRECYSSDVQELLRPFIEKGNWQPTYDLSKHGGARPVSLSLLTSWGGLTQTSQGLVALYTAGATPYEKTRSRWQLTDNIWRDGLVERVEKAQLALLRLGPTLVSEGLLSQ